MPRCIIRLFCALALLWSSGVEGKPSSTSAAADECTNEQHRPRYHFSAAANWLNDPNGMVWYDGVYHLFYQYHPYSSVWGPMHWGHATSSDMINWTEQPIALYPDEHGTIFSGSAVIDKQNTSGFQPPSGSDPPMVAVYTSALEDGNIHLQRQSIAYSLDQGKTFIKYEGNPVLTSPNNEWDFRDPKVMWHRGSGKWMMVLAVGNKVEFFSSPDLKNWTRESSFGDDPPEGAHGGVWECPELLEFTVLDDQEMWLLLVSINPGGPNRGSATQYFVGRFDEDQNGKWVFKTKPVHGGQWLDWGPDNYAAVSFSNEPKGRHVVMGWMNNWAYANNLPTATWRGQVTLPRNLGLVPLDLGGANERWKLISNPAVEVQTLRRPDQRLGPLGRMAVEPQTVIELTQGANFSSPLLEVELVVQIEGQPSFSVCAYNDLGEESCLGFNDTKWFLDRQKSGNVGFNGEYQQTLKAVATREIESNVVFIRMYLDVSSVEVFLDGGFTSLTALHYPSKPFDKVYINHWSPSGSQDKVTLTEGNIWGLRCWFDN